MKFLLKSGTKEIILIRCYHINLLMFLFVVLLFLLYYSIKSTIHPKIRVEYHSCRALVKISTHRYSQLFTPIHVIDYILLFQFQYAHSVSTSICLLDAKLNYRIKNPSTVNSNHRGSSFLAVRWRRRIPYFVSSAYHGNLSFLFLNFGR